MRQKIFYKEILINVQEKLLTDFKKSCEANYKNMSEVVRELMLQYVKNNKL